MRTTTLILFILGLFCLTSQASAGNAKGEGVYMNFCSSCHASGIAGAPKTGDKQAWEARIATGREALVGNAIKGYQGDSGFMPAKGGNAALSDDEVAAAVDFMISVSQ